MNPDAIKTGGHAFPHGVDDLYEPNTAGMTLRDYFAASVMGHLVCSPLHQENSLEGDARYAYLAADAMLAARGAA